MNARRKSLSASDGCACNGRLPHLRVQRLVGQVIRHKHLRNQQGQHHSGVCVDLHRLGAGTNLAPRHRLVRTCTRVGSVELLSGSNQDRVVSSVAHQVRVANVVLHHAAAQDEHARVLRRRGFSVHQTHVRHQIQLRRRQLRSLPLLVELVERLANPTIHQRRGVNRQVVDGRPRNAARVQAPLVQRSAHHLHERRRREHEVGGGLRLCGLGLGLQDFNDKGDNGVARLRLLHGQVALRGGAGCGAAVACAHRHVLGVQRTQDVEVDAAAGRDDDVDHAVPAEEVDGLARPGKEQRRRGAEEDLRAHAAGLLVGDLAVLARGVEGNLVVAHAPRQHRLKFFEGNADVGGLVAHGLVRADDVLQRRPDQLRSFHDHRIRGDLVRRHQNRLNSARRRRCVRHGKVWFGLSSNEVQIL
eukprot:Rhum_TRINITY_DN15632_c0_g1::Rhum_TRINITY_DN15632_c0_g1_i1::g.161727::m.161727